MIEIAARITRTEGETAWVVSEAPSSCGACGGKGCGSSVFARLWHPQEPEYRVDNFIDATPGATVIVGIPEGALLGAVASGYLLPLLLLFAGAGLGHAAFGEPGAILGGLFGLVLAGFWLRHQIGPTGKPATTPVVLRLSGGGGCTAQHA